MHITVSQVIVWIIVGALAGSFAGMVVTRQRAGFGRFGNFGVGLVGAVIGGLVTRVFKLNLGLGDISVSLEEVLLAFLGSLLFLGVLALVRRKFRGKPAE